MPEGINSLFFRSFPEIRDPGKKAIVVLHGLFGSSKNWVSISKALSAHFQVFALDLRNHGDSFHLAEHSIPAMADDLLRFLDEQKIQDPILLGHSMGGLVSMYFALQNPNRVTKLLIEDIAPKSYPFDYQSEVEALSINVSLCQTRSEVDTLMQEYVKDPFLRQFLQMNLERKEEGGYFWKLNVPALQNGDRMFESHFKKDTTSELPACFVLGGDSSYVREDDKDTILSFFPKAIIQTIPGGGHFIHYTHASQFLQIAQEFLLNS